MALEEKLSDIVLGADLSSIGRERAAWKHTPALAKKTYCYCYFDYYYWYHYYYTIIISAIATFSTSTTDLDWTG